MAGVDIHSPISLTAGSQGSVAAVGGALRLLADHPKRRHTSETNGSGFSDLIWEARWGLDVQKPGSKASSSCNGQLRVLDHSAISSGGWSLRSAKSVSGEGTPGSNLKPLSDAHPTLAMALKGHKIHHIADGGVQSMQHLAKALIMQHKLQSNFYLVDVGRLVLLYEAFVDAMPRVQPFYAAKCNPDAMIMRTLAALGCGFDCASAAEMRKVLDLGVPASRIIFAHPCKVPDDLQCAVDLNVKTMTFDCEDELDKISEAMPDAELVIRIKADDTSAFIQFGHKFGAEPLHEAPALLRAAQRRNLVVVGVSFHIGSGSQAADAYRTAIRAARHVFDVAKSYGFDFKLLDLGGGFYGRFDSTGAVSIGAAASVINNALAYYFPIDVFPDLKVIAEPGRYFAQSVATFFSMVHTAKFERGEDGKVLSAKYYICDGVYGSFNSIIFDHGGVSAKVLRAPQLPEPSAEQQNTRPKSTVFGPTCDGIDLLFKEVPMPLLRRGDWLQLPNYGAYTIVGACRFNGMPVDKPPTAYVWSAKPVGAWETAESFAVKRGEPSNGVVDSFLEQQLTFQSTLPDLELL